MGNHHAKSAKKRMNKGKLYTVICIVAILAALIATGAIAIINNLPANPPTPDMYTVTDEANPVATIEMESGDFIVAELYPDIAPNTVANFVTLANDGFYDGLIFHRVIRGFMIQGGDPTGTGMGGPGYHIHGEFSNNGFENNLLHTRGVLSMARSEAFDSAGSQFFIMHANSSHLDGNYASFGKVVYGMKAVDAVATTETNVQDRPLVDQVIKSIRVDTKGTEYTVTKIGG